MQIHFRGTSSQTYNEPPTRGGTEPGSARLVTKEEKSSEKARLGGGSETFGSEEARLVTGSETFGSWLGSARSKLARRLASQKRAKSEPKLSQIFPCDL